MKTFYLPAKSLDFHCKNMKLQTWCWKSRSWGILLPAPDTAASCIPAQLSHSTALYLTQLAGRLGRPILELCTAVWNRMYRKNLVIVPLVYLEDPGKARGCSTNTPVIN